MAIEYFCAYHSYLDSMEELNDTERGRLFTACLIYSKTGEAPQLRGNERFVFPTLKAQIDRDKATYDSRCKKNSDNIRKRWNTDVYDGEQPCTNDTKTKEKEKEKEKTKENNNIPPTPLSGGAKAKRVIPPTVDEVAAYCQERGNGLDPETFVDFYASKGWMVGKNLMKDWKAAVRTWERSEGRGTSGAGNRVQPRATEEHGLDKLRRLYEEEFGVE